MSRANVYASPYAIAHPEAYELVALRWQCGVPLVVELRLVDATDLVIDEESCTCDLDAPCNNPRCVMERDLDERSMRDFYNRNPDLHAPRFLIDRDLHDAGRGHLVRHGGA
jgi:hypothetical protein